MATRYQVDDTEYARNRLADLWTQADATGRAAMSAASHRVDRELRLDAEQKGFPVNASSPDLRIIEVRPLRVSFEVSELDCRATIIDYELIS